MVEQDSNDNFIAEFLDDYFSESEEHLVILRRGLLAMEQFINQSQINRQLLDELFRSFHSLKGISGMVGVREAELLAHHMESYLRTLREDQAILTQEGLECLMSSTRLLEQVIFARREQQPPPDIETSVAELEKVIKSSPKVMPQSTPATVSPMESAEHSKQHQPDNFEKNGSKLWRFEFVPSTALAQNGININLIRSRLQELGELKNGIPRVLPGGGIAFEFIIETGADESTFSAFSEYGITYAPVDEPPATVPEPDVGTSTAHTTNSAPLLVSSNVVRVSLGKLDDLMRMVGELVISRAHLDDKLKNAESTTPPSNWRALQETNLLMERQLRDLRDGVMRVRMVPIGEIFERMRFVVRDLAREYGKKVELELSGQETEIDKLLIERMMDPLMHLVRNAVSHGLEPADEREALGKPVVGTIVLRAFTAGDLVVIEIEDDGRGVDQNQVIKRASSLGLIAEDAKLDQTALLDLICSPGFSTRDEADRTSGRGVGMAVVKNTVLGLGGELSLDTEIGRGTRFVIRLPITLSIADALIFTTGDQKFAIPQTSIREVMEIEPSSIRVFENNEIIPYRNGVLPIIRLSRLFGMAEKSGRALHAFVIGTGLNAVGIVVGRIIGQREIVVRTFTDPLIQVNGISGATELGDGRVVLILDAPDLVKQSSMNHRS